MNEDWLERALAGAAEPHIDDDGFTLRVMRALPPAPRQAGSRSDWILVTGAATGSAVAASQFPLAPFVNLLLQSAQVPWLVGIMVLGLMAVALVAEPLRRVL
ncbi:MAG: hypothetical protein IPJ33_18040 [Gammaproteobacteria bacterium]|jgi:hypothetical protein|nr:hypothetical protein [Gammaproteobacteria bacterium]MBP6051442.1 hypothetical protein [Pseudomonadales bacterium]MBK7171277.1 hypothetical protein [Gammaproteobacteria bacterium]MBK7518916.1 hypothetical protein [Gammaproteobacteria bacterium]MBK7730342.1 hypothetical protein [Gammaproteobacteria bacterium]